MKHYYSVCGGENLFSCVVCSSLQFTSRLELIACSTICFVIVMWNVVPVCRTNKVAATNTASSRVPTHKLSSLGGKCCAASGASNISQNEQN